MTTRGWPDPDREGDEPLKDLKGKRALVTGAAGGIGRCISLDLAREGVDLVLVDVAQDRMTATAGECRAIGVTVDTLTCDLTKPAEITAVAARVVAEFGGVDILVNNAGLIHYGPTAEMPAAARENLLAVNLAAPMQLTCELLPSLRSRYEAHIVFMSGMYGLLAVPRTAAYHATKFGLVGWSESLHREYGRYGLGVTVVCPGFIRTDMSTPKPGGFKGRTVPEIPDWALGSPEAVAAKTIRGIKRNARQVLVNPVAYLGAYVARFAPWLADVVYLFGKRRKMRQRLAAFEAKAAAGDAGAGNPRPKA